MLSDFLIFCVIFILKFFSILDEQLRLSLITSVKEIYEKSGLKGIVKERVKKLENEIITLMEDPLAKYLDVRILNFIKKLFRMHL